MRRRSPPPDAPAIPRRRRRSRAASGLDQPFFDDKNRAFWILQTIGWSGYFFLRTLSGFANSHGLDVARPHAPSDRDGLFADPADGLAVPAPDQDEADVDAGPFAGDGDARFERILGHRDVERVRPSSSPASARSGSGISGPILLNFALLAAWSALYYGINYFLLLEEQIDQRERLESQASTAQLAMLRYQLNPHFLFNTLNSISTLVLLKQTERANAMLARLSSFLRYTLANEPTAKVTLAQEVETLKLYLEIEKMRFEERLAAAFPDRVRDDRRAAALAAAAAADRKRDQICGDPEPKTAPTSGSPRSARARRCGSKSPTMATATGRRNRGQPVDRRRTGEHSRPTVAGLWRRASFRDQKERSRGALALSSKFPMKPETRPDDHPDHFGRRRTAWPRKACS